MDITQPLFECTSVLQQGDMSLEEEVTQDDQCNDYKNFNDENEVRSITLIF